MARAFFLVTSSIVRTYRVQFRLPEGIGIQIGEVETLFNACGVHDESRYAEVRLILRRCALFGQGDPARRQ